MSDNAILTVRNLTKTFQRGEEMVYALQDASFEIARGEFASIVGPSGSGKTTLLNLIGLMERPASGEITIDGQLASTLSERQLTRMRAEKIGFVFQHFGLLPTLTVEENVALPSLFTGRKTAQRAAELLERVGLSHRKRHRPSQLSGGEMQRAAIARALLNQPALLLADEPTGNLDQKSGESILQLFQDLNQTGLTIIVVTHNPTLAEATQRCITLQDGRIVS